MSAEQPGVFSRRALGWVVGIGSTSFLLAFVLAALGEPPAAPRTLGANSFSRSAIGHHALATFLRRSGFDVGIRRDVAVTGVSYDRVLLLVEPEMTPFSAAAEVRQARERTDEDLAPMVLVLPKWSGVPARGNRVLTGVKPVGDDLVTLLVAGLAEEGTGRAGIVVARPVTGAYSATCESAWGDSYGVDLRDPQFIEVPDEFTPVLTCDGHTMMARHRSGSEVTPAYIVTDPDLLNNQGLARADHARLVRDLFGKELEASGVVFDETVHGFAREAGLLAEMMRFPLVLLMGHGAAMLGLLVWAGAGRFGTPVAVSSAPQDGKRVLIDNAAQLLSLGGHALPSLRTYFEQSIRAVGAHFFFRPDTPFEQLAGRLDEISKQRGITVDLDGLRRRLREIEPGGIGAAEQVRTLAIALHHWRQEMTLGAREDS